MARKGKARELSTRIEQQFARDILKLMTPARQLLRAMKAQDRMRADAARADQLPDITGALVGFIRDMIPRAAAERIAKRQMLRIERFGRVDFERWSELAGIDPKEAKGRAAAQVDVTIAAAIEEAVNYIQDIPAKLAQQVSQEFNEALLRGERGASLTKIFEERLNVAQSRAKMIARDQSTKALGNVQKVRQQALGVSKYEWVTAGDERVRPSHAALNGKVFSWDAPPAVGHPGADINCRCVAVAVFDD